MSIVVVDLGTGNLRSVAKAVEHVMPKQSVIISNQPNAIRQASRIILPGQGAIGTWMQQMSHLQLRETLMHALQHRPVLGICVGMQALFEDSEEDGGTPTLGIISGHVKRLKPTPPNALTIPQMGWNKVFQGISHPCWHGIKDGARFYFANSYAGFAKQPVHIAGSCEYGVLFTAAVAIDNVFAVQFHPEKSQHDGLQLINNFMNWNP